MYNKKHSGYTTGYLRLDAILAGEYLNIYIYIHIYIYPSSHNNGHQSHEIWHFQEKKTSDEEEKGHPSVALTGLLGSDDEKAEKQDENEEFKVLYIGCRSNNKHPMFVNGSTAIGLFKKQLFAEHHGAEIDTVKYGKEQIFTNKHNLQLAKSGKVLIDTLTFADYNIHKSDIPYELKLKFTLDASGA
jgi:hypothetical protein